MSSPSVSQAGKQLVIGVDLDGVCADFYSRIREIAAEWFERPIEDLSQDVSYALGEWGLEPGEYDSLHRFAVTERDLFRTVPMIPGARRVLRKLSNEGYRIRIITHRLFIRYFHELAVSQTIHWLDHHGIPYWDLCFMKEKLQVGADIYVEDSPDNVASLRASGNFTICFGNTTNKHLEGPRATTWDEVYDMIKTRPGHEAQMTFDSI